MVSLATRVHSLHVHVLRLLNQFSDHSNATMVRVRYDEVAKWEVELNEALLHSPISVCLNNDPYHMKHVLA